MEILEQRVRDNATECSRMPFQIMQRDMRKTYGSGVHKDGIGEYERRTYLRHSQLRVLAVHGSGYIGVAFMPVNMQVAIAQTFEVAEYSFRPEIHNCKVHTIARDIKFPTLFWLHQPVHMGNHHIGRINHIARDDHRLLLAVEMRLCHSPAQRYAVQPCLGNDGLRLKHRLRKQSVDGRPPRQQSVHRQGMRGIGVAQQIVHIDILQLNTDGILRMGRCHPMRAYGLVVGTEAEMLHPQCFFGNSIDHMGVADTPY